MSMYPILAPLSVLPPYGTSISPPLPGLRPGPELGRRHGPRRPRDQRRLERPPVLRHPVGGTRRVRAMHGGHMPESEL